MPEKTIKTYRLPVDAIRRASQGERIVFRPKDEPAFAVVPVEDAEYMERLEDELDNRLADEALAEGGDNIPLEQAIADYEGNMACSIDLKPEASKKLNSFDKETHRRILKAIIALAGNPRTSGCTMLKVEKRYRIRVGDFRIVYEIHDSKLLVLVVRIEHRSSVYR